MKLLTNSITETTAFVQILSGFTIDDISFSIREPFTGSLEDGSFDTRFSKHVKGTLRVTLNDDVIEQIKAITPKRMLNSIPKNIDAVIDEVVKYNGIRSEDAAKEKFKNACDRISNRLTETKDFLIDWAIAKLNKELSSLVNNINEEAQQLLHSFVVQQNVNKEALDTLLTKEDKELIGARESQISDIQDQIEALKLKEKELSDLNYYLKREKIENVLTDNGTKKLVKQEIDILKSESKPNTLRFFN
ncbi:hypothetical protein L1267_12265 [Pseudoalteromonas sp. OFAV1]|uniref:hypothetical protein n=1 Tax=Pseudoalteromonas sp. OFAV1 TaxID=2908892 RepID=UPI001F395333|nr:hypothetical protein [Pseudoalteromonas sp. OFAV1]MCF2901166.1 hypothetical protein [Pseudoalteromonas sp. OFAV1]